MKRLLVANVVGIAALVVAVVVAGQESGKGGADLEQQARQADTYLNKMRNMLQDGLTELETARKIQNVNRVNCVNEALTAMKGLLRLAEGNMVALQEALARKDKDGVEHEYVKISIAFAKSEELSGQLQGCGAPSTEGAIDGKPYIEKQFDSDLPTGDPTKNLKDLPASLQNPPSATPYI